MEHWMEKMNDKSLTIANAEMVANMEIGEYYYCRHPFQKTFFIAKITKPKQYKDMNGVITTDPHRWECIRVGNMNTDCDFGANIGAYFFERPIRKATVVEKNWLNECIKSGRWVSCPDLSSFDIIVQEIKDEIYG